MTRRGTAVVTGAAGFLGQHVVRALLADGWDLRCAVRSVEAGNAVRTAAGVEGREHVDVHHVDMRDSRAGTALLAHGDVLIHMAASGSGSAAALFADTVSTTRRLMQAASDCRIPTVLVSSFSVYRTDHLRRGDVLDETCPLEPRPELRDAYAFSKLAQEQVCSEAAERSQVPLAILRPSVIYGPGRGFLSSRVGLQVGARLFRFGGGHALPYVYVENCADAVALAAKSPEALGRAVNVVDDELPTPRRLTAALAQLTQRPTVVAVPLSAVRVGVAAYARLAKWSDGMLPPVLTPYKASAQWKPLRYSNALAKQLLRWAPRVPLDEAIAATLKWESERRVA